MTKHELIEEFTKYAKNDIKGALQVVMWRIPEIAPRTGEMILADMGLPWPSLVCWNKNQDEWVYVSQQMNFVDGQEDPYFENEYGKASELKGWMPLPELAT